jgi:hypothetical protein
MTGKEYIGRVHDLACVVCAHMGKLQTTPTIAHHVESVRDDLSAYASVALCDECHKLLHHMSRRGFMAFTKLTDIDLMALTIRAMAKELT